MRRAPGTILTVMILTLAACSPVTAGRWRDALKHAATDPGTWVPAAGAIVIAGVGYDDDLSEWAVREAPVFGSPMKARGASDLLRTATHAGMLATSLFAHPEASLSRRFKGVAVQFAATSGANNSASVFKRITRRRRPDGSDELSLPSNHATAAFAYAAVGSRNLERINLSGPFRRGLGVSDYGLWPPPAHGDVWKAGCTIPPMSCSGPRWVTSRPHF